ncbi:MAG: DUF2970 domain-containing protein [Halioglobus sp.]
MSEHPPPEGPDGDKNEQPLSFWETLSILISGHLGVRKRQQRADDFRRANGLHIFIAAVIYFAVIVLSVVLLVRYIAG